MRQEIQDRCMLLGQYIVCTGATVRQAAERFGMSKSSVHKDVHERLRAIHPGLYAEVREILDYHHAVRHLRGGAATRLRWKLIRQSKMGFSGGNHSLEAKEWFPPDSLPRKP